MSRTQKNIAVKKIQSGIYNVTTIYDVGARTFRVTNRDMLDDEAPHEKYIKWFTVETTDGKHDGWDTSKTLTQALDAIAAAAERNERYRCEKVQLEQLTAHREAFAAGRKAREISALKTAAAEAMRTNSSKRAHAVQQEDVARCDRLKSRAHLHATEDCYTVTVNEKVVTAYDSLEDADDHVRTHNSTLKTSEHTHEYIKDIKRADYGMGNISDIVTLTNGLTLVMSHEGVAVHTTSNLDDDDLSQGMLVSYHVEGRFSQRGSARIDESVHVTQQSSRAQ